MQPGDITIILPELDVSPIRSFVRVSGIQYTNDKTRCRSIRERCAHPEPSAIKRDVNLTRTICRSEVTPVTAEFVLHVFLSVSVTLA